MIFTARTLYFISVFLLPLFIASELLSLLSIYRVSLCAFLLLIVFTTIAVFYASLSPVCSLFFFALVHLYVARIINIRYHRYLQIFVFVFSTPSSITSFLFKNDITFLVFLVFYTQHKMYQRAEFSSLLLPLFLRLFQSVSFNIFICSSA